MISSVTLALACVQAKDQLRCLITTGAGSNHRIVRQEQTLLRERALLEKRCNGMDLRLNNLETYNERLVTVINAIRKQNAPHRQAMKHVCRCLFINSRSEPSPRNPESSPAIPRIAIPGLTQPLVSTRFYVVPPARPCYLEHHLGLSPSIILQLSS